jgi:HNH endonuclease
MSSVPARLRRLVVDRATSRCEYCGLAQAGQEATFHIDHIVPEAAGGSATADNLALAWVSCSLRKESRRSGKDSQTGRNVALFHPRRQEWSVHFCWDHLTVLGLTPTGRATIAASKMNRPVILAIRQEEAFRGRHPPPARERKEQ